MIKKNLLFLWGTALLPLLLVLAFYGPAARYHPHPVSKRHGGLWPPRHHLAAGPGCRLSALLSLPLPRRWIPGGETTAVSRAPTTCLPVY